MITPRFSISQDALSLIFKIYCPYTKFDDLELYIDDSEFKFFSSPYYLRLFLPGKIVEDDKSSMSYDFDSKSFVITVSKVHPGESFVDLDLLTKLLIPSSHADSSSIQFPNIQVYGDDERQTETVPIDWSADASTDQSDFTLNDISYGFGNKRFGVFKHLKDELIGVVDLPEPDSTLPSSRRSLRVTDEDNKFDANHYLADYCDTTTIQPLLSCNVWWFEKDADLQSFSTKEKDLLLSLPRKEYILNNTEAKLVYHGLIDILLAYCYDHRSTEGEHTVESGWTICKLSSTLSWFEEFANLTEVIIAWLRRSLSYPLYRSWNLSQIIIKDVIQLLTLGKKNVLKAFLSILTLLQTDDLRYLLADLYITDYCVWIQSVSDAELVKLSEAMKSLSMTIVKEDVGLPLIILESIYNDIEYHHLDTGMDPSLDFSQLRLTDGTDSDDIASDDNG